MALWPGSPTTTTITCAETGGHRITARQQHSQRQARRRVRTSDPGVQQQPSGDMSPLIAPAPRANSASERVVPLKFYGDHPAFSVQSLGHRGLGSVRWREPYADTPSYVSFELHIWHAHTLPVLSAALVAAADH